MSSRTPDESLAKMESILREEVLGYLGLQMDGMPYVVPLNYAYFEGTILFHCALSGKKLDCIRANPQACFTVGRQVGEVRRHAEGEVCHKDSDSVICYGVARIIEDMGERQRALNTFNHHFRPDAAEITLESALKCCAVEIKIAEMTGREEREGKRTYWRYRSEQ